MVRSLGSSRAFQFISTGLLALACAAPAIAQDASPPGVQTLGETQAPAHISLVDGVAVLERDGQTDDAPGNMPLLAGDRVRTRGGRVEILFADGSTLHLDHNSVVDLQSDELLRLVEGRIRLSIPGPERSISYRIDGPHGWARITEPGEYRVAVMNAPGGSELELAVIRGRAELANEGGATPLRAGERAFARAGAAPSYAYVANSAAMDAFDRWSEGRRDERMSASAEYLPDEVQPYAASLERHGDWRDEPTYGHVWYPRVATDWRPYYRGRWVSLRPYGWTWVAHDPWGWPTHHYGRWGYSTAGAWFWIPGRTWGAAWVSWASAPGYVSWCPLGWNNRPVFQIGINIRGGYDPWRAWTVIPQRHFGYGYVQRNVVRITHIDQRTRGAFSYRDRAPEIRGHAVPRGSAPIRVAGSQRGRRDAAPLYTNLPADQGRMRGDGARVRVPNGSSARSPGRTDSSDGVRERAVPARPAVRSERPVDQDRRPGAGNDARSARQRAVNPRASSDTGDQRRSVSPRPSGDADDSRRAVSPRGGDSAPASRPSNPRDAVRPPQSPAGIDRAPQAPARIERSPKPRRPSVQQDRPRYRPDASAPSGPPSAPSRRAVPRAEPSRPGGEVRRSPGGQRGPDRPSAGSNERRAPAAARPPASSSQPPPRGGSAAPKGARPRPGGG